jgi:hypothetical protein
MKPEYPEKTTDLPQVTDKLYHVMVLTLLHVRLRILLTRGKHLHYRIIWILGEVYIHKTSHFLLPVPSQINATFKNISVISWRSVLLVDETGVPGEHHRPAACHWQTLSRNVLHLAWAGFELTTSVVLGTDCLGSCKSNYHMITATTSMFPMAFRLHPFNERDGSFAYASTYQFINTIKSISSQL